MVYIDSFAVPIYYSPNEDTTLGEIVDSITPDNFDNYTLQYYSIDAGYSAITESDRSIICPKNKLMKFGIEDGKDIFLTELISNYEAQVTELRTRLDTIVKKYGDERRTELAQI